MEYNYYKLNEDYELIKDHSYPNIAFKTLNGPYKNVAFVIKEIKVVDSDKTNELKVVIDFEVVEPGDYDKYNLQQDVNFIEYIGDVFNSFIRDEFEKYIKKDLKSIINE